MFQHDEHFFLDLSDRPFVRKVSISHDWCKQFLAA